MDVIDTATALGLTSHEGDEVLGTIEEEAVLAALAELSSTHPGLDELFAQAASRVQQARSAGLDRMDPGSVFAQRRSGSDIQLRYRADILDVFIDLAIDVGMQTATPADAPLAS